MVVLAIAIAVLVGVVRKPKPAAAPAAAAAQAIQSIAVLPLRNLGGGDYFADGMTEALIADLEKPGTRRHFSHLGDAFQSSQQPLPEIARAERRRGDRRLGAA